MKFSACPFCGMDCAVSLDEERNPFTSNYYVECGSCLARGPMYSNQRAAIDGWEKRIELTRFAIPAGVVSR